MRHYNRLLTIFILAGAMLCSSATTVFAANISVDFEQEPLFSEGDIKPGDTISRTVVVTNTSTESQDVYVKATNGFSTGNLASTLYLTVTSGTTFINNLPISSFIDGTPRALTSNLANGASATYTFSVAFPSTAGNEFQLGSAGFDFCVGFSGGDNSCVSDGDGGGETPVPTTPPSGGGGGGGGPVTLTNLDTFNENALNITLDGDATIVWDTNLPATSKVVYGLQSGGPYSLNLFDPNFGYPATTAEETIITLDHSLPLSGLIPGETYVYRVASRQNPGDVFTVSPEFIFTVPLVASTFFSVEPEGEPQGGATGGGNTTGSTAGGVGGTTGGDATTEPQDDTTTPPEGEEQPQNNSQAAAALFGLPDFLNNLFAIGECDSAWIVTIITLIAYLIATWWGRDMVDAKVPIARTFSRTTIFALLGAVSAMIIWFIDEDPYEMFPLLVMALLMAGSALLDFFTADSTLPYTRLFRTLVVFVTGVIGAILLGVLIEAWCYIWPLVLVLIVLFVRLAHLFTSHRDNG